MAGRQILIISCMAEVTIGYWRIRGLAQTIRLLLSYTQTPFREVFYDFATKDKWFEDDKKNLGLDFPNIPYLIDGDFKLTQSSAIARYVIKRSGHYELLGKNGIDEGTVESIIGVTNDIMKELRNLFGNPHSEQLKAQIFPKIQPKIESLKLFVADRPFAVGYLTLADFYLSEFLYYFQTIFHGKQKDYGFWFRIRNNFEEVSGIKAYYQRPDAIAQPFLPPMVPIKPVFRKVKLAYWAIRGLAQVPRLLLSYLGVPFEDYYYTNTEQWFKEDRHNLGIDFPNLPYLLDGRYSITDSNSIQRYICEKWGDDSLLGRNIQDNALLESFLSVFVEIAGAVKGLYFHKDHETAKVGVFEKYKGKLEQLNKFVGNKRFVLGYLTLADFIVAEESHYIERLYPNQYANLPFLQRVREQFNELPQIRKYYEQPTAFKGRFFPEYAVVSIEN